MTAVAPMHTPAEADDAPSAPLVVQAWVDEVVDARGHDPHDGYVERFWLPVLGPSAILVLRHLADLLDEADGGAVDVDRAELAAAVGLRGRGRSSVLGRTLDRLARFHLARTIDDHTIEVRRRLPVVPLRHQRVFTDARKAAHQRWVDRQVAGGERDRRRAQQLAVACLVGGEDRAGIERLLLRWRTHPIDAAAAAAWAWTHRHRVGDAEHGSG